jgi:hypothetical protein
MRAGIGRGVGIDYCTAFGSPRIGTNSGFEGVPAISRVIGGSKIAMRSALASVIA